MRLVYINRGASPSKYAQYLEQYNNRLQQQGQKYNQLLMEGLVENGAEVFSISTRPINRAITKQFYFKGEKDTEKGIHYDYIPFFNYKVLRELSVLIGVFLKVLFFKGKRDDTVILCDALNIAASIGALAAAALRGFFTVGIVTDVPGHLSYARKVGNAQRINLATMRNFQSYLLLTKQMSEIVNPKNRPYIVMEGHVDQTMAQVENTLDEKYEKKVVLYAGSLMEIYGIGNLVEGFLAAKIPDAELHIYGDGNYAEKLQQQAAENATIRYFGNVPNSDIIRAELKATLLVNPRPTNEDYTQYSFPSKNMEYMASGTPVLTTKLPGMPEEYYPYIYLLKDESAEGVAQILQEILSQPAEVLAQKGADAKKFVLEKKNNIFQAKKLLDMAKHRLKVTVKE